jgi:hypothetical protein
MAMCSTLVSEEKRMASVFDVLDEIRKRPTMYVGYDESKRAKQLQTIETLMDGYSLALRNHDIQEHVRDFNREFGAYLWETREWSASCGPIAAIREAAENDEDAWHMFWKLVDEFRSTVEAVDKNNQEAPARQRRRSRR